MTVRPETHPCRVPGCVEPHPYMVQGSVTPAFCPGTKPAPTTPVDLPIHRDGAAVRPPGRRFEEVLREAFEAGRQHALSQELDGVGDAPAPDFDEWRRGQLP